jgi:hypothetical protein
MPQVSKADLKLNFDKQKNEWRMAKDMGHAQGPGNYPKLEVANDHQGQFVFKIQNPQGTTFSQKAFVPKAGKNNPGDFAKQFTVTGQGTDTLTVSVANSNTTNPGQPYTGGEYHYELLFTDKPALDPIITNRGCCQPPVSDSLVYVAFGAVALLALWFFVVRPMMRRRSTR